MDVFSDEKSLAYKIYGSHVIYERHRHRYEVETKYIKEMEAAGLFFTASDETRTRMEVNLLFILWLIFQDDRN